MNIFLLDKNPEKCAAYHTDRHVVKMIVETAQLLCTAHWESLGFGIKDSHFIASASLSQGPPLTASSPSPPRKFVNSKTSNLKSKKIPYKSTHKNHPCAIWARESLDNYDFLCALGLALCKEYTFRYGKRHKTQDAVEWCIENKPAIERKGITKFAQAMPEAYKSRSAVKAYRDYYNGEKKHLFSWKGRNRPRWVRG